MKRGKPALAVTPAVTPGGSADVARLEKLLVDLTAATEAARQLLPDVRGAIKDLRDAAAMTKRDIDEYAFANIRKAIDDVIMSRAVDERIMSRVALAQDAICRRFEKLQNTLLYGAEDGKPGDEGIALTVHRVAELKRLGYEAVIWQGDQTPEEVSEIVSDFTAVVMGPKE